MMIARPVSVSYDSYASLLGRFDFRTKLTYKTYESYNSHDRR